MRRGVMNYLNAAENMLRRGISELWSGRRPYLIRRPALAHKNPTCFSRGSMSKKDFLIMARIIYKNGCEGQNRLECIEGIEIDLLNGQKALIYPKYSNEELLDPKDRDRCHDAGISETAALRLRDNQAATAALLEAKSPAARFVTKFTSERFGRFGLPTLLAAMEITEQEGEIDKLARYIDGADLLEDFSSIVWSCSRFNALSGWYASGLSGCTYSTYLFISNLAVPLVLLDTTADGVA